MPYRVRRWLSVACAAGLRPPTVCPPGKEALMLYWACVFLVIALLAAAVGFGLAGPELGVVAKALCVMFLGLFVMSAVAVMTRAQGVKRV
jgi:uncharacterized membrane protein YtjA (UPF0391 family)